MRPRSLFAVTLATAVSGAVVPALATSTGASLPTALGCGPKAIAHYAGGAVLVPQPTVAPVTCGTNTGFGGAESHIVTTPKGTVLFTPAVLPKGTLGTNITPVPISPTVQSNAAPAGLAVTKDRGRHWSFVKPLGLTWNPTDHGDYVDQVSGRIFFEDYGPIPLAPKLGALQEGPAHINWSDDEGATWQHSVIPTVFLPENPRFTSAVPVAGQAKPHGYPRVVYFCANTNVGFTSPAIAGRRCWRSLNGGASWQQRSVLFAALAPQHPECGSNPEEYSAIDGNYPQPTRAGALYVMVTCGGTTYLARSDDEAGSFPVVHRSGNPVTMPVSGTGFSDLRIGPDDVMYLMYSRGDALMLRISRDFGVTWTPELNVMAPGVVHHGKWAMTIGGARQVAVAYLGQRAGQTTWDGYVTATYDSSASSVVFWSGQVNPATRPLLYGDGIQGAGYLTNVRGQDIDFPPPFSQRFAGNDFIGSTMGAGTPWGSFTQDCGPAPDSAGCVAWHGQTRGFAGYLRWL